MVLMHVVNIVKITVPPFLMTIFCVDINTSNTLCPLPPDRSFEDDDSVDGNRSSSAQAAFKVPKVPKKPAESSAARRPSATGSKLGTECTVHLHTLSICYLRVCKKHFSI